MFSNYDLTEFPIVRVNLEGGIKNKEEFIDFTNNWENLYKLKQKFMFIFETKLFGVGGSIPIKYCFYVAKFIKRIKKKKYPYLTKSIICVYNKFIMHLLNLVFAIQSPIAPVYIINCKDLTPENKSNTISYVLNNDDIPETMTNYIKYITP